MGWNAIPVLDDLAVFEPEYFTNRQAAFAGMANHVDVEKNVIPVGENLFDLAVRFRVVGSDPVNATPPLAKRPRPRLRIA